MSFQVIRRLTISLDGWSSSNNFKVDYVSRDIFPVGWCRLAGLRIAKVGGNPAARTSNKTLPVTPNKQNGNVRSQPKSKKPVVSPSSNDSSYSPTTMDEKNNNLVTKPKSKSTSCLKKEQRNSNEFDENIKTERPIVTVYLNYMDDNSGMLLNPQKFRVSMPSIFGPAEIHTVLATIFNSCIKCAFQQTSFLKRILDIFPVPKDQEKDSYTQLKLDNGTIIFLSHLDTLDDFWDVIRTFQNVILSGNDLFISTPPVASLNNQSNGSSSSFLDSSVSPDKKECAPANRSTISNAMKRKSTELISYSDNKTFISNGKSARSDSNERSVYDTKPLLTNNTNPITTNQPAIKTIQNGGSRRPERYTPSEVAAFVRGIDPSFDSLATRFLQEEIDGKALLLLNTDTLMRHMGLKLGPSLKIVHHIENLKKS
ncbi:hypothetical protein I4U23_017550 [Adineta vaga]|nr:hypothetical protein I4U23_017550 [Adineta vaga]